MDDLRLDPGQSVTLNRDLQVVSHGESRRAGTLEEATRI
jgi:hypothetical protein